MSTEHSLLVVKGNPEDLSAVNIELDVVNSGTRYSLELYKTHPTIQEAFEHTTLVDRLSSEELERLAVRLLYIASIQADHDVELLRKYNLPLHDDRNVPLNL